VAGEAYVGETLAGSVGGWKDPTTDFLRRWVRCEADGGSCTYIQQVGSTDPETGPTYVIRPDDLGYTLRLRVTADVNGDLTPDGTDNHLPHAVEVDSAASAVVTERPIAIPILAPGGGGGADAGPGPGPGPGPGIIPVRDTTAPKLSAVRLTKRSFVAGKGTAFRLTTSEAGTLRIVVTKPAKGRKVGARCKPQTKSNRRRKACTYAKVVTTIRRSAAAGPVSLAFSGKVSGRKLAKGRYTATFVVTDAAGNVSKPVSLLFTIKRK
jgi:hypothetical protein